MKYFKDVKSYDDLKEQYRELIKANHPDNGGSEEAMKEINVQFDVLFAIWKDRRGEEAKSETAESVRRNFYTERGWQGSRYTPGLYTTEISKAIRVYCKEKYPTWKFSVRTETYAGGASIHIYLMEAPVDIFDREYFAQPFFEDPYCHHVKGYRTDCWTNFSQMTEENSYYMSIYSIYRDREHYEYLNDLGYSVLLDVYNFMESYRYDDSDSMIDYFSTNFYGSIDIGKWDKGFRIVPKTARIKNQNNVPATQKNETQEDADNAALKSDYTYTVTKDTDTRDGSTIWVVKIAEHLDKDAYIAENKAMKQRGGYYSKYKHGFIFRENPTSILTA